MLSFICASFWFTLSNFTRYWWFPFFKMSKPRLFSLYPYFLPHYSYLYIFFGDIFPVSILLADLWNRFPLNFHFSFPFLTTWKWFIISFCLNLLFSQFSLSGCYPQNLITHGIVRKVVCPRWSLKWSPTFPFINFHFAYSHPQPGPPFLLFRVAAEYHAITLTSWL